MLLYKIKCYFCLESYTNNRENNYENIKIWNRAASF